MTGQAAQLDAAALLQRGSMSNWAGCWPAGLLRHGLIGSVQSAQHWSPHTACSHPPPTLHSPTHSAER